MWTDRLKHLPGTTRRAAAAPTLADAAYDAAFDAAFVVPGPRREPVRRVVTIGTGYAGTARHLLLPAVQRLRAGRPGVTVRITSLSPEGIRDGLLDGSLDLGVHARLDEEADVPAGIDATVLLRGRLVVALSPGHALAGQERIAPDELRRVPFVGMPEGHLLDRLAHRLFEDDLPVEWHVADGAETAKLMVAEALGVTILPDYSIAGDPLERAGLVTSRPLTGDRPEVVLQMLQHERSAGDVVVSELTTAVARRAAATGTTTLAGA